jgi:hypothetical protein
MIEKNPHAFPSEHMATPGRSGMTLRDYFAAKAMQSILIDPRIDNDSYRECAEGAYKAADAMLKAREA